MLTQICLAFALQTALPPQPDGWDTFLKKKATGPILSPKATELKASLGAAMLIPTQPAFVVPPNGFMITNISVLSGQVTIGWQNGTPPFQLEGQPDLGAAWSPVAGVGPTMLQNKTFPAGANHYWRVRSQVDLLQITNNQPRLQWSVPEIDMSDSLGRFKIYRRTAAPTILDPGDFSEWGSPVADLDSTVRSWSDTTPVGSGLWYKPSQVTSNGVRVPYPVKSLGPNGPGTIRWAKGFGGLGTYGDFPSGVAVTASKDIILFGRFQLTVDFTGDGTGTAGNGKKLTAIGDIDVFVARYTPTGTLTWVKQFGKVGTSLNAKDLAVDASDNVFIAGTFDGGQLIKLNSAGVFQWIRGPVTPTYPNAIEFQTIAINSVGSVVCSGEMAITTPATMDFGSGKIITIPPSGTKPNLFLAKYQSNGTCDFAYRFQSFGDPVMAGSVAIESGTDKIYISGYAQSSIDLGGGDMLNDDGASRYFGFLGKLQPDGSYNAGLGSWQRRVGWTRSGDPVDSAKARVRRMTVDSANNIVVLGEWNVVCDFGGGRRSYVAGFGDNLFIAKYNGSNGAWIWDREFHSGYTANAGRVITVGAANDIYIIGSFSGWLELGNTTLTAIKEPEGFAGFTDAFIAKYASDSSPQWAMQAGGTDEDFGSTMVMGLSDLIATGSFKKNANGTPVQFGPASLTSQGYDIYLMGVAP